MPAWNRLSGLRDPAIASLLLALALGGACRKSSSFTRTLDPSELKASCNKRAILSQCSDYSAKLLATSEKSLRRPCDVLHSTFSATPCPADNRIGSCEIAGAELRSFYQDGPNPYERARAQRECALAKGGWLEP